MLLLPTLPEKYKDMLYCQFAKDPIFLKSKRQLQEVPPSRWPELWLPVLCQRATDRFCQRLQRSWLKLRQEVRRQYTRLILLYLICQFPEIAD